MGARAIRKKGAYAMSAPSEVALGFDGLTQRQPHLLGSAIQGHDELPQKVHPQQPVHRGRVNITREKYRPNGTGSVSNASNFLILLLLRQDAIRSSYPLQIP